MIIEPAYDKLGWHASDTHGITLTDCRVPAANMLGARGSGLRNFLAILDDGRVAIAALAVVTFEPGSHALVSGGGEPRRRFLDWGLFHVEPDFLSLWRRYSRALKQRNALLKQGGPSRMLDTWDHELAEAGVVLA